MRVNKVAAAAGNGAAGVAGGRAYSPSLRVGFTSLVVRGLDASRISWSDFRYVFRRAPRVSRIPRGADFLRPALTLFLNMQQLFDIGRQSEILSNWAIRFCVAA